jgi:nucleotide-binding universal stress UspA family protein
MSLARHVLIPVDFSSLCERAASALSDLAPVIERVTLVHVHDEESEQAIATLNLTPDSPKASAKMKAALETQLAKWGDEHLSSIAKRDVEVVMDDHPAEALCRRAAELDVSLIVIPTHGRTGLAHLLMGSVAEHVVQKAPCPVLVVRRK